MGNEQNRSKWSSIVDENFKLILPVTPYRAFPSSEIVSTQRHIVGINALMEDCGSLNVMFQSIVKPENLQSPDGSKPVIRYQYYCGDEDTVVTSDANMCGWILRTENAVGSGALFECYKKGMMRALFSPQNKLILVEQVFDVMSFMHQLLRASGSMDFRMLGTTSVVPGTAVGGSEEDVTTQASTSSDNLQKLSREVQGNSHPMNYESGGSQIWSNRVNPPLKHEEVEGNESLELKTEGQDIFADEQAHSQGYGQFAFNDCTDGVVEDNEGSGDINSIA